MKPKTKARHLHRNLCRIAERAGYKESEFPTLKDNQIIWEQGPFEWAICLVGGDSIFASELANYSFKQDERLKHQMNSSPELCIEAKNSYSIGVYD